MSSLAPHIALVSPAKTNGSSTSWRRRVVSSASADLLVGPRIAAVLAEAEGDLPHVLEVVGAGAQELARLHRRQRKDLGQRRSLIGGRLGQFVERFKRSVPVLEQ